MTNKTSRAIWSSGIIALMMEFNTTWRPATHTHTHTHTPRPWWDTAWRTSLARRPWPGVFQAGSDSSPVSERPRTTVPAFRPPVSTLGSTCVPPTVNCLQYLATGSTLTAVGPFRLPAPKSATLYRISSGTRPSVQTLSDVCLKRTCSLDTSAFNALEVLDDNRAL